MQPCKNAWQKKWLKLDCHSSNIQAMADLAEEFCRRWCRCDRDKTLLLLVGASNCGKTHVAKAIFNFARAAAFSVFERGRGQTWRNNVPSTAYFAWPAVVDGYKEGHYGCHDDMMETDLLILDDVGAEHDPSKSANNKLCQVLSRRERMFTVITTNVPPERWTEAFDTRVADRLLRNSVVVNLTGLKSYAMLT
jgi:DNA replication protein DnaC